MNRNPFKQHVAKMTRLGFKVLARGIATSIASVPAGRPQERFIFDFSSIEGAQKAAEWYQSQPNIHFMSLEYRKEKNMFQHEFIVVHLNRNSLCRFDRRAVESKRADALNDNGTLAEDSAHILHSYQKEYQSILSNSEVLLKIEFPRNEDLRFILAVCYAIQTHQMAKSYSLLCYNCYFFSWTVTAAIARRAYAWEAILAPDSAWKDMIEVSLDNLMLPSTKSAIPIQRQVYSTSSRIKAWFHSHMEQGRKPSVTKLAVVTELLSEFQTALKHRLNLDGYQTSIIQLLEPILLKSQLTSVIANEVMQHVKGALWQTSVSLAKKKSLVAVEELVTSRYYGSKDLRKNSIVTVASWQLDEYLLLVREGITKATEASIKTLDMNYDGLSTDDIPRSQYQSIWEEVWDYTWEFHWNGSMNSYQAQSDEITNLGGDVSVRGKEVWRMAWDAYRELGNLVIQSLTRTLQERLVDLDPMQLEYGGGSKNKGRIHGFPWPRSKHATRNSEKPQLQEFIQARIHEHFDIVDKRTFRSYEELRGKAESTMTEIWKASLGYFNELANIL